METCEEKVARLMSLDPIFEINFWSGIISGTCMNIIQDKNGCNQV
jgi:hypothetical protein